MINQKALRRMFPGICFYIVEGPDVTENDLSFWVNYLAAAQENIGSTTTGGANYRADEVAKASLRGMPTKIGPGIDIYDPELLAMIGMEL